MIPASAILITKEKQYPQDILEVLCRDRWNGDFEEIIIEDECPNIYRRYELAKTAKSDLIFVQDDDCISNPEILLKIYDGRLTNILSEHHQNFYRFSGITLLGFGAFFPKKMIDRFSIYLDKFGIDDLFLSEADRVFSFLNQPFNSHDIPIKVLPRSYDKDRMSMNSKHWLDLGKILKRLETLRI